MTPSGFKKLGTRKRILLLFQQNGLRTVWHGPCSNHGNADTDRKLGGVFYSLAMRAEEFGVPVVGVTASQVRATGCHKHALYIAESLKGAPLHETHAGDEADAIGVLLAGLKVIKEQSIREADGEGRGS